MAEPVPAPGAAHQVVRIVTSYVRHHQVAPGQLVELIGRVGRTLASVGVGASEQEPRQPAVPIRRSVLPDHVVCLECGFRGTTLRRHLRVQHGLDAAAYRARWQLSPTHPITAPGYSQRRSAMAKRLGLGRRAATNKAPTPPPRRARFRQPTQN